MSQPWRRSDWRPRAGASCQTLQIDRVAKAPRQRGDREDGIAGHRVAQRRQRAAPRLVKSPLGPLGTQSACSRSHAPPTDDAGAASSFSAVVHSGRKPTPSVRRRRRLSMSHGASSGRHELPSSVDARRPRRALQLGRRPQVGVPHTRDVRPGQLEVTKLDQACDAPALPAECPSPSPTWGDSCDASLACMYPSAMRCVCSSKCDAGAVVEDGGLVCPYVWSCYAASSACPNPTPQAGSPCSASDEGIDCRDAQYHVCGILVRCVDGLWQWTEATNCPVLL